MNPKTPQEQAQKARHFARFAFIKLIIAGYRIHELGHILGLVSVIYRILLAAKRADVFIEIGYRMMAIFTNRHKKSPCPISLAYLGFWKAFFL